MSDAEAAIAALKARFLTRAADDLAMLRRWSAAGARADQAHQRIVHRLAGAAGTFGFAEVSALAKRVEDSLAEGVAAEGAALAALLKALAGLGVEADA